MKKKGRPHFLPAALIGAALVMGVGAKSVFAAGGFFSLKRERGTWWLAAPDGRRFLSLGVSGVSLGIPLNEYQPARPRYCALRYHASDEKWRKEVGKRLEKWGFNTLGFGADEELAKKMPYVVGLGLGAAAGVPWEDPAALPARLRYREVLVPMLRVRDDPNLIGYILDRDLGWWDESVFLHVLKQSADKKPLKREMLDCLRSEYGRNIRAFLEDFDVNPEPKSMRDLAGPLRNASFRVGRRPLIVEEFVEKVADRYYRVAVEEIRKIDRNHLIFSDTFGPYLCQAAVRAAARYVDALAVSPGVADARGWPSPYCLESLARLAAKPVLVAEFSVAARENNSGNANVNGVIVTVDSQLEREKAACALAAGLVRFPSVIGCHWYQFSDQPPSRDGEAGGADFNTGLVDIKDGIYERLTQALARVNAKAEGNHGSWPGDAGLARSPQGWLVRPLPDLPIVDGELDEWQLNEAWVPDTKGAAPFERFGDVYVSWHPEGIALGMVYCDYRSTRAGERNPPEDSERLTLGFGLEDEKPVVFTLKGIQVLKNPDAPEEGFFVPEVTAVRGGVPFPPQGRFLIEQKSRGVERVVEIFLPAALFKVDKLEAGSRVRMCLSLRLRANFKEMFWPASFRVTDFSESGSWAALVLRGRE